MNDIKTFNNPEFGSIRTVEVDGKPYFVGKDVAEILGYSNPRDAINKRVDEEDKGGSKMRHPWRSARFNGNQRIWYVQPDSFE